MKISARQYASCLLELLEGKKKEEAKEIIKKFVALLAKRRELGRQSELVAALEAAWNEKRGELPIVLESTRKLEKSSQSKIGAYLEKKSGAAKVTITEVLNEKLLGGFVLRYGDRVLDGSLKNNLDNLRNKIRN
jgi:F-type H+-transporting ATPase subunit delta